MSAHRPECASPPKCSESAAGSPRGSRPVQLDELLPYADRTGVEQISEFEDLGEGEDGSFGGVFVVRALDPARVPAEHLVVFDCGHQGGDAEQDIRSVPLIDLRRSKPFNEPQRYGQ
jgi:hypothetical protein